MIKRLIWTIWTLMSSVLKKANKLNLSLYSILSPSTLILSNSTLFCLVLLYSIPLYFIVTHYPLFYPILLYSIPFYSYSIPFYYIVPFYSILSHSTLFYPILLLFYPILLYYPILFYSIPLYSIISHSIISHSPLFCPTLFYPTLLYSVTLYYIPFYSILSHSILSHSTLFCHTLFYPILLYFIPLYSIPLYSIMSHPVLSHSILSHSTLFSPTPLPTHYGGTPRTSSLYQCAECCHGVWCPTRSIFGTHLSLSTGYMHNSLWICGHNLWDHINPFHWVMRHWLGVVLKCFGVLLICDDQPVSTWWLQMPWCQTGARPSAATMLTVSWHWCCMNNIT